MNPQCTAISHGGAHCWRHSPGGFVTNTSRFRVSVRVTSWGDFAMLHTRRSSCVDLGFWWGFGEGECGCVCVCGYIRLCVFVFTCTYIYIWTYTYIWVKAECIQQCTYMKTTWIHAYNQTHTHMHKHTNRLARVALRIDRFILFQHILNTKTTKSKEWNRNLMANNTNWDFCDIKWKYTTLNETMETDQIIIKDKQINMKANLHTKANKGNQHYKHKTNRANQHNKQQRNKQSNLAQQIN